MGDALGWLLRVLARLKLKATGEQVDIAGHQGYNSGIIILVSSDVNQVCNHL